MVEMWRWVDQFHSADIHRRELYPNSTLSNLSRVRNVSDIVNCSEAVARFPSTFFSLSQLRHGAVTVHLVAIVITIFAISHVCHYYFVPSLTRISEACGLEGDVVGSTFMSMATSTPLVFIFLLIRMVIDVGSGSSQLLVSFVGEFVTHDDIGVGDLIGSAAFNGLFVPGFIAICSKEPLSVRVWPVVRDCTAFLVAAVTVICVFIDKKIQWYEGLTMILIYVVYIVVLFFNSSVQHFFVSSLKCCIDYQDLGDGELSQIIEKPEVDPGVSTSEQSVAEEEEQKNKCVLVPPPSTRGRIVWVVSLPITFTLSLFIPDFRIQGCWRHLYIVTFLSSAVVLAVLSWLMMWMIAVVGYVAGIRESVMGLTFLAMGTSLPDLFASQAAVKMGFADMAISNCIASNVFELMFCMGLPLLIRTLMRRNFHALRLQDAALAYSSMSLVLAGCIVPLFFVRNKWTLDRRVGCAFITSYLLVISIICLLELYFLGDPHAC